MFAEVPGLDALVLMSLVVAGAAVVQAALGMGYGMVAAPLLALIDPVFVPAPTIMIGMITSTVGAWSERSAIVWSQVQVITAGRLCGILLACAVIFAAIDERRFLLVFGLLIAAAVAISVSGWQLWMSTKSLFSMGGVSGLMGTITGVGAPPLALVYSSQPASTARPTLAATFALGCGLSVVGLTVIGWVGPLQVMICAAMLPAMFLGTLTGRRFKGMAADRYRPVLLCIAGISSVLLIAKGWQM